MVAAIVEAIKAFFESIPYFDKWFSKAPAKKVEKTKKKVRKVIDEFKETGRPKWGE